MAWIKSNEEIATHPKVRRAARLLNVSVPTMIGHLHIFWWWCLKYAQDGNLSRYEWQDIAEGAGWEGDPDLLLKALIDCGYGGSHGFLERTEDGLVVHDWMEYAGKLIDNRQANAERMRNARSKHVQRTCDEQGEHVQDMCDARTGARVDKSRVDSITDDDDNARARARDEQGETVFSDAESIETAGERPTKDAVNADPLSASVETEVSVCPVDCLSGELPAREMVVANGLSVSESVEAEVSKVTIPGLTLVDESSKCNDGTTSLRGLLETKSALGDESYQAVTLHVPVSLTSPLQGEKQATKRTSTQKETQTAFASSSSSNSVLTSLPEQVSENKQTADPEQEVIAFAEANFGRMLSPSEVADVLDWCNMFRSAGSPTPESLVMAGLKRCVDQNQRKISYLRGIMTDWLDHGVISLADIVARDEEWSAQKERMRTKRRDPPVVRIAAENAKGVKRDAEDKQRPRYDDAGSYDPSAWERAGFAVSR